MPHITGGRKVAAGLIEKRGVGINLYRGMGSRFEMSAY
jgi:hypothetical protein